MAAVLQQACIAHLLFCSTLFSIVHLLTGCGAGGKTDDYLVKECEDTPGWDDGGGNGRRGIGCNAYNFRCNDGEFRGTPSKHNYPDQNCCECGKGGLGGCVDTPGWEGWVPGGCNAYDFGCNGGEFTWGTPSWHNYPDQNCCKCGKGKPTPIPTPAPPKSPPRDKVSDREWEHYQLVKQLRRAGYKCPDGTAYGPNLGELEFDCRLWRASQLHSQDMEDRNYFFHAYPDGSDDSTKATNRVKAQGMDPNAYSGENLHRGSTTASGALESLKTSKPPKIHCNTMMHNVHTLFAVSLGFNPEQSGVYYWTQMYAKFGTADRSCYPNLASLANISGASGIGYGLENASHFAVGVPDIVP